MPRQRLQHVEQTFEPAGPLPRQTRGLSPREQQVFALIGKGKTTKEIAAILSLSTATIGNHRKSICSKLDIHSTAELVSRAALGDK